MNVNGETSMPLFLSKLFNGTLFAQHDESGKIIKGSEIQFDLRGELGVSAELLKQAIPVIANECFVRCFYFIRRFAMEFRQSNIASLADIQRINWRTIKPYNNPTIARMLTVSTGVFTALDIGEAVATQKYWMAVNYVGIGKFAIAVGADISLGLKFRNVKRIREVYETMRRHTFRKADADIYRRIGDDMDIEMDKLGLSLEQIEIVILPEIQNH